MPNPTVSFRILESERNLYFAAAEICGATPNAWMRSTLALEARRVLALETRYKSFQAALSEIEQTAIRPGSWSASRAKVYALAHNALKESSC
jgi:hypothetical protein